MDIDVNDSTRTIILYLIAYFSSIVRSLNGLEVILIISFILFKMSWILLQDSQEVLASNKSSSLTMALLKFCSMILKKVSGVQTSLISDAKPSSTLVVARAH
ncbi:MAG: hypothetical protein B6U85_02080 [Desulfurococcales archaeon ex4484_42]|nr:MAG: hypothetical protein B6U85_02080 [Desulfurococcales archaeon ex4484_42]